MIFNIIFSVHAVVKTVITGGGEVCFGGDQTMGGQPSHTAISPLPRGKTVLITGGNTGINLGPVV